MLIIPAIDLKEGSVVRLYQGRKDKKVYSADPVRIAKKWSSQGARLIHVVDLDGAFTGRPKNIHIARKIAASIDVPVEFGGGVRDIDTIKTLIDCGFQRVVLGTKAAEDKNFLKRAFGEFKNRIIVSIDVKKQRIMTQGWKKSSLDVLTFVRSLKKMGFKELIYTDTLLDGTLKGPNIEGVENLLDKTGMRIIASGGISGLDDIIRLKVLEKKGLAGIIVGKALYEKKFTLTKALKAAKL